MNFEGFDPPENTPKLCNPKKHVLVAIKGSFVSFHTKSEGTNLKNDLVMAIFMIYLIFKILSYLDFLKILKSLAILQILIFFKNSNSQHLGFY